MNPARKKDIFRLIRKTKGRFLSLTAIITIGVAFFVGVSGSSYIMGHTVDDYADETKLRDLAVYSLYGFDEEDIKAIEATDGVAKAEGAYFADVIANGNQDSAVARVHSWKEDSALNNLVLKEGRLPANAHEALTEAGTELSPGMPVGTKVRFTRPDDDLDTYLKVEEVTVVGTVDTPLYINETKENGTLSNRYIETYFYVPEEAFALDVYTEVSIESTEGRSLYAFSDDYREDGKTVKKAVQKTGETQASHRRDEIVSEAKEKYDEGYQEYLDGLDEFNTKIADAEQQLNDAENEIRNGRSEIRNGEKKLNDAQAQLDSTYASTKAEIEDGLSTIADTRSDLTSKKTQVEEGLKQIGQLEEAYEGYQSLETLKQTLSAVDGSLTVGMLKMSPEGAALAAGIAQALPSVTDEMTVAEVTGSVSAMQEGILTQTGMDAQTMASTVAKKAELTASLEQINTGLAQLDTKEAEANSGLAQLEEGTKSAQAEIDAGWTEIRTNKAKLDQAERDLNRGREELDEQKADGEEELDQAKADLAKAKQDIEDLETNEWTVIDRSEHYGMETYKNTVDQMAAIGRIFPLFFFLVSALVCLTTMTRMVDEERGQLGILRALGYTPMQCASKYLIYAGSAALIGCVLGCVIGLASFPAIIYNAWRMLYIEPPMEMHIPWALVSIATVSFVGVMLLTTLYVSYRDMHDVPSQLLRPKAPKIGKSNFIEHIGFIWKHVSFTWKVTIRNLLRYKRRLVMTVIGVAGCTALMITGFGVRDSIDQMVRLQFDEIQHADGTASLKEGTSITEANRLREEIESDAQVEELLFAISFTGKISANGVEKTAITQVFENNEEIESIYTLRTRKGHHPLEMSDEGIIITEKLSEDLNVKTGDEVTIESKKGIRHKVKVTGIAEMYVQHYVFLSKAFYTEVFDTNTYPDTYFLKTKGDDSKALQKKLAEDERIAGINFYDSVLANFKSTVKSMDFIVLVLIVSSMALAFVVLGNLTNINISERQREIATLKVLGFRKPEIQSYIYKESNVLTLLGGLAGIPLGIALHHWIMREVEFSYVMYGRDVMPLSLVISVLLTVAFGLLVNWFMKKKLQNIEMVESLKSVE